MVAAHGIPYAISRPFLTEARGDYDLGGVTPRIRTEIGQVHNLETYS